MELNPFGSGGVETDAEGFTRPGYNATCGASEECVAEFHVWDTNETLATCLDRNALK
jgi:hypothetical protein